MMSVFQVLFCRRSARMVRSRPCQGLSWALYLSLGVGLPVQAMQNLADTPCPVSQTSTMMVKVLSAKACDRAAPKPSLSPTSSLAQLVPRDPPTRGIPQPSPSAAPPVSALSLPPAESVPAQSSPTEPFLFGSNVDIPAEVIEESPVLRRWLEEVPDVATDIQHDPAFRTRARVGYAEFPSTSHTGGIHLGIQDVFVGRTPLTLSAEYTTNGRGDRALLGVDAQYYLLPLGWYGNVAPVLGYRIINNPDFDAEGINLGFRIVLIPSRTGAVDLSLTQSWVAPGTRDEVGLTTFSAGYAITRDLRLATDIQTQNTTKRQESRVSLLLEWML